jgi:hypothetical protein
LVTVASVVAHGLRVEQHPGWDVHIYRRATDDGSAPYPVVHAGNFPLPRRRGDFGVGAVERMGPDHVLVVLFEYEPAAVGTPLFARQGRPRPKPGDFHPRALQRTLPGQAGAQWFFTEGGRPFSLYVVLGSWRRRETLVEQVRSVLDGMQVAGVRR